LKEKKEWTLYLLERGEDEFEERVKGRAVD
jgi:hypothetical protein